MSDLSKTAKPSDEFSGGPTTYYTATVTHPLSISNPYCAECSDIIEALNMSFAEGEGVSNVKDGDAVTNSLLPQVLFTNDQKKLAHLSFNRAISQGLIIRPDRCEKCRKKSTKTLHGHHHRGYAEENWLNTQFLCNPCHVRAHRAVHPWDRFLFNCKLIESCWVWGRKGPQMKFSPQYGSGWTIQARAFSYCRDD